MEVGVVWCGVVTRGMRGRYTWRRGGYTWSRAPSVAGWGYVGVWDSIRES